MLGRTFDLTQSATPASDF